MSKKQGHHAGHSHKHTSVHKHSGTGKHHQVHHRQQHHHKQQQLVGGPLIVHKHPHHPKARGLALGEGVACCTAEALAASLRLAGWPVGDADVLALHEAAGGSRDMGVTIEAALQASAVHGLAGIRPQGFHAVCDLQECGSGITGFLGREVVDARLTLRAEQLDDGPVDVSGGPQLAEHGRVNRGLVAAQEFRDALLGHGGSVVLGLELPGPHAVTVDGPGLWTWGEWHPWECFPGAVAEEAWAVRWPAWL